MPEITCPAQGCTQTFRDDLDATVLSQLISIHAQSAHPPTAPQPQLHAAKMERVRRPTISSAGSTEEWEYFLSRWDEYKLATRMEGQDILLQLIECADEDLRKDLNRAYGTLTNDTEENALKKMKTLAVKLENILVARVHLHNLKQDRDETVRGFSARLRGQAKVCQFTKEKTCNCGAEVQIDYSEDIIRDTLIRGLADEDIQLAVLGQQNQKLTLEETLQITEAKESGKRSAGMLTNTVVSMNAASSYKRNANQKFTTNPNSSSNDTTPKTCNHCGQKFHGRKKSERKKKCPAFNHTCGKCGILHHYESVCRSAQQNSTQNNSRPTTHDAVFHEYTAEESKFQSDTTDNSSFFNAGMFDDLTASKSLI